MAGADTTRYRYDAGGALRDVWLSAGTHVQYAVDAEGRRTARLVNGVVTQRWLYQSALAIAAEVDSAGTPLRTFTYGAHANVPDLMRTADGQVYRLLTEQLGSVRLVLDASADTVVQRLDYDAWGVVTRDTKPGFQPFGYAGGLYDPLTGLVRFGARDYDAATGRWTDADPLGFAGGSANVYEYARNRPTDISDPTGQDILLQYHVVAGHYMHAFIRIEPLNTVRWFNDSRFIPTHSGLFVTLGAGPSLGMLVAALNRRGDRAPHVGGIRIRIPEGCTEDQIIERLLALHQGYANDVPYDFQPFNDAGFNSNSYAHGILSAAGLGSPQLPDAIFPDWSRPLPPSAFGVRK